MRGFLGFAAMGIKEGVAYPMWFWVRVLSSAVFMIIAWYFWRAIYVDQGSVAGIGRDAMLRYALFAQMITGASDTMLLHRMAFDLREGRIAHDLLMPLDFQSTQLARGAGQWAISMASRLPLLGLAVLLGVDAPGSPVVWLTFVVSFLLGAGTMFFFEWMLSSVAFYTTEVWGIGVTVQAVTLFFGGTMVPLDLMPAWLRAIAEALPFQQAIYRPVTFLAGMTPLSAAPRVLAVQLAWALGLAAVSRVVFARASRAVTVQGG